MKKRCIFMQFWRPCTGRCTGVHGRAHLRKVKVLLSADQKVRFLCSGTGWHGPARSCMGVHGRARACTGVHGHARATVSCCRSCTGLHWLISRCARAGARAGMGVHCWQNVDFCFRNAIFSCFLYWAGARTCKFTNNSNKYLEQ